MKKSAMLGTVAVAVALILVGGASFWRPAYRQFRERRALAQAQAAFARGDFAAATLFARQVLMRNTNNLGACRIMADLAEASRSPVVIDWRRRVAELEPTPENKLVLASCALRNQSPPFAASAQILEELSATASNLPGYHLVSAEFALRSQQPAVAAEHFAIAAQLEPTNRQHQLNLAVLRLGSSNALTAAAARATLESFRQDPNLAPVALRWLVGDALRRREDAEAQEISQQLLALPAAALGDQLQHFGILKRRQSPDLGAFVSQLERQHATNPPAIYVVADWMAGNDFADEALAWLRRLPERIQNQQPVPLAINDCLMARGEWRELEVFLQGQAWKETEFLRLAYLSLVAEKLGGGLGVEGQWRLAVREAEDRLGALTGLLTLAERWKRDGAREEILWKIADRFPREKWAYRELTKRYVASGNTRGLNKLFAAQLAGDPNNPILKNDLAATSLLLNLNLSQAAQLARDVYTDAPDNPIFASTYAFSLQVQGKTAEALAIMEKLKPEARSLEPVALYHGLLLWAAGQTNEARPFLNIASTNLHLLPEEQQLLSRCR